MFDLYMIVVNSWKKNDCCEFFYIQYFTEWVIKMGTGDVAMLQQKIAYFFSLISRR
jgi:hypothetical protein